MLYELIVQNVINMLRKEEGVDFTWDASEPNCLNEELLCDVVHTYKGQEYAEDVMNRLIAADVTGITA